MQLDCLHRRMNRRTLLVGMKLTPECRERLTWIIATLTRPGDHVVAVHVVQSTSSRTSVLPQKELDALTREELDFTFQGVLGVYQSICNLKQIKLDIKVVVGASIKEALVDAAKLEDASKLILGTSKFLPTGFSTSLAKFCLKRLPPSCAVTVIDRGKVIFDKEGTLKHPPEAVSDNMKSNEVQLSPSQSIVTETTLSESDKSFPDSPVSVLQPNSDVNTSKTASFSLNKASRSLSYPQQRESTSSDETRSQDVASTSSSGDENGHGWPLRAFPIERATAKASLSRKLSVVNWAMQLPSRSRETQKPASSNGRASVSTCNGEYDRSTPHRHESPKKPKNTHRRRFSLQEWCSIDGRESITLNVSGEPLDNITNVSSEKLRALCSRDIISSRVFTEEELDAATCSFSEDKLIGRGGCSMVYEGLLSNGQVVAVKRLNEVSQTTEQELMTEVETLSTLRHRNVINMLGYCVTQRSRMLVYNYMHKGNLEESLHGVNSKPVLEWDARHKIALGASEALEYLHDGCPRAVVHRDIKSSNILLSSDFEPQISDFGLAKWAPPSASHIVCTDVVGTFGYLAPEYFMFGKVNEKTDVYSFGVVLLELITGRRPIDASRAKGRENLVTWGRPLLEDEDMDALVDPKLENNYDTCQMLHMILAAALCLRQSPQFRPHMRKISAILNEGNEDVLASWARHQLKSSKELDEEYVKDEIYATSSSDCDVSNHLALAMIGVDETSNTSE